MSDTYRTDVPSGSGVASTDSDGKIDQFVDKRVEKKQDLDLDDDVASSIDDDIEDVGPASSLDDEGTERS